MHHRLRFLIFDGLFDFSGAIPFKSLTIGQNCNIIDPWFQIRKGDGQTGVSAADLGANLIRLLTEESHQGKGQNWS